MSDALEIIDSHCHFDMPAFDHDRDDVGQRARSVGIVDAIVPGVEPSSWPRTVAVARRAAWHHALGIHPQALPDLARRDVYDALAKLEGAAAATGAVAIGECGLDGGIDLAAAPMSWQREVLAAQVEIARALSLPIVLHVLRAHAEAIEFLRTLRFADRAGVVHSYSGSAELVPFYVQMGFFVSFAGGLTRERARRPVAAARAVPFDRLLVETDAPDQTPTGATTPGATTPGSVESRCEPAHIRVTLACLARVRDVSEAALAERTTANARELFALPAAAHPRGC